MAAQIGQAFHDFHEFSGGQMKFQNQMSKKNTKRICYTQRRTFINVNIYIYCLSIYIYIFKLVYVLLMLLVIDL